MQTWTNGNVYWLYFVQCLIGDKLEIIGNSDWSWCKARLAGQTTTVGFIPSSHIAKPGTLEAEP